MKVLFVSDSPTVSGAELVTLGCMDSLRVCGHTACAFIRKNNSRFLEALRSRSVSVTETSSFSNRLIRTTTNPIDMIAFARSFYRVTRELSAVIRAERADVIHSISYPAALYTAFAAVGTNTPHIWHEHNIKRIHRINRSIYRHVGRTCRWVIGPSDAVTSNLAKAGIEPAKLRTVYNGIDLSRFQASSPEAVEMVRGELGLQKGERAIGLFGQMLPHKGHRTLIDAAPQLLLTHPEVRFYIVGALENPPYEQQLKALLATKGLSERFYFTGWRNDVHRMLRAMDVVVVPTVTPEPFGLVTAEALACERAVVASSIGGTTEIIVDRESGLLFTPGNAADLASRIGELLEDPALMRSLGAAGRRRIESMFNSKHHLESMVRLFESTANTGCV